MNTRRKGRSGEDRAVEYLLQCGYRIVSRNYETRQGEIDCIAEDPCGELVFVEVKSAGGRRAGHPFSWVTPAKQRQIARMAQRYLAQHRMMPRACRFDVIAVLPDKIDHLRNAFLAV